MEYMMKNFGAKVAGKTQELCAWTRSSLVSKSGQGTTEYAILVGVSTISFSLLGLSWVNVDFC
ncbi:Uncharacterised protein [Slackia heliotrinireducens]|uniref:Uncharacterized protein n=1 Tax=Slackia heliotrinireducens (strain ATCC 29202 / DSM 20476 / NCTC 11029 / RHS 1) TaxID=471855 RepID=C7N810_SLAHD|nr:hypothetical protein [Slackia heliotrinireducens]ACV23045.1 hypothetical protein Shel_20320 [Slackia heliotrinireducens DSM 20476]VEH01979.1 Uncharacterised protein [Slackia heliotrinireducens]